MTIRSTPSARTILATAALLMASLDAQSATDASGRRPADSGQSAVDVARRRRAAAGYRPEWQFLRTVGARNGVSVIWDTRTNVDLRVYNATNDHVQATFTVTAYDRAGGAWPRRTFVVSLAPQETKRGFSLSPGRGQRTEGAQVVVMPRILIRNFSQEARDRAIAEVRRRSIEAIRRRSELDAQRRAKLAADLERDRRPASTRAQRLRESRERAVRLARGEAERRARQARQLELARQRARAAATRRRAELERAQNRAARLAARRAAERIRIERAKRASRRDAWRSNR
ncbi:MAG: hypothetical protein KDC87_00435 [Planctomycetes bacterium]|nr:hypothetical protein [Planctomycetota bacterium]